jgi:hypothetical protein
MNYYYHEKVYSLAHHFIPLQLGIITGANTAAGDSFETRQKSSLLLLYLPISISFFLRCVSVSRVQCSEMQRRKRREGKRENPKGPMIVHTQRLTNAVCSTSNSGLRNWDET